MNGKQSMAKRWMVAWLLVIWARAQGGPANVWIFDAGPVSSTHLRAPENVLELVCRLLLEKKTQQTA